MALKVGELYALFTIDQSQIDSSLDSIRSKLTGMSTSFTRAGTLWSNALTRPIVDFGKDSVNTAMDFGKEMSNAMAKFGFDMDTPEGVAEYEEAYAAIDAEVMRVAKDSIFTTAEAAGAIDKMAMAGWSWEASVAALEPIMDLAAASGEDLVTVSDIVTDAMTAFGYTFESAGGDMETFTGMVKHFSNVLATAATSSNTDIGMMGESFKYAATMAGAMGYSVDDVGVALGLMANRGTKASQAGTSLRTFLTNIINPKGEARLDAIATLGLDLRLDEDNMLDFKGFMDQVREKFGGLHIDDLDAYIEETNALAEKYPEMEHAIDIMNKVQALGANRILAKVKGKDQPIWTFDYDNHTAEELNEAQSLIAEYSEELDDLYTYEDELQNINNRYAESQENPAALMFMQYASDIGGVRGMLALLAIANASAEEYNNLVNEVANADVGEGRTHQMKEMQLDNAQGSLDKFLSSVNVLKTEIGALINESLVPMIDTAKEIIDNFIEMDDEQKKSIMDVIGLAAAIGPALIGVGALAKLLPALGTAFSFLTSPMGLIVAMFGAMAFSALDAEGNITKGMQGIADALGLDTSGLNLDDFDLNEALDSMFDDTVDFANSPTVTKFMEKMGNGLQGAIDKIGALDGEALVKTLLSTITGLAESDGVNGFMKALGEGFKGAMGALGNLAGEIIAYILSPQGLSDIWDAGLSLGTLLINGIAEILGGIGKFFDNLIESALISWGVIDPEEMKKQKQEVEDACNEAIDITETFVESMNSALSDGEGNDSDIVAALFGYGINQLSGIKGLDDIAPGLVDQIAGVWSELWQLDAVTPGAVKGVMAPFLESVGIALEDVPDTLWSSLVSLLQGGDVNNQNELMNLLIFDVLGIDPESLRKKAEETAAEAGDATGESLKDQFIQEIEDKFGLGGSDAEQAVTDTVNNVNDAIDKEAGALGKTAVATAISNQSEPAKTAALTVSDAVVQQFLLNLSAENGAAIGNSFATGIINAINTSSGLLTTAAALMAHGARNAVQTIMSYTSAFSVGRNFGQGLVNGINAMIGAVADAAAAMGAAAGDSLSGAIQEGSPSKLTAETGMNFGLGFINAILNSAAAARNAAALMGLSATDSLNKSISDLSRTAADQMSVSANNTFSDARSAENDRYAQNLGAIIAGALNGAKVEMNGRVVGELVTETVSEGIAEKYAGMRYGTV